MCTLCALNKSFSWCTRLGNQFELSALDNFLFYLFISLFLLFHGNDRRPIEPNWLQPRRIIDCNNCGNCCRRPQEQKNEKRKSSLFFFVVSCVFECVRTLKSSLKIKKIKKNAKKKTRWQRRAVVHWSNHNRPTVLCASTAVQNCSFFSCASNSFRSTPNTSHK